MNPLYSYEAETGRARVYNRTTGATVCDVTGVDTYVGNLLSRLADEMYKSGHNDGYEMALGHMRSHLDKLTTKS